MDFSVYDTAIVPIIVALVELAKRMGLPSRWAPLLSVALGIIAGYIYLAPDDLAKGLLLGIMAGLSASGLYSGGKALANK